MRTKASKGREIYGRWREAEIGSCIELDSGRCERLLPGDDFTDSGWPGCDFRFPNPIHAWHEKHAIACNIEITGRTFRYRYGENWLRIKIEWVGDCEPSTFSGGWMKIECPEEREDNWARYCASYKIERKS